MKRFRMIAFFALLVLIILSACGLFSPSIPATSTNPNKDLVGTIVADTLTAIPSSTPMPEASLELSLTPIPTQTATLPPQTASGFIFWYFDNINSRNYELTWSLLTDSFKNSLGGSTQYAYLDYVTFWNTVRKATAMQVHSNCEGDLCAVNVTLKLDYYNGKSDTTPYPYTLTYDHARATCMFDYIPVPTATRSRTPTTHFTHTRTPTPTITPTPSKTRTATITPTKTFTRTPKTRTPTATRTSTPTHKPTKTASNTKTPTPTRTHKPSISPTFPLIPSETLTPTTPFVPSETETPTQTLTPPAPETPSLTPSKTPPDGP